MADVDHTPPPFAEPDQLGEADVRGEPADSEEDEAQPDQEERLPAERPRVAEARLHRDRQLLLTTTGALRPELQDLEPQLTGPSAIPAAKPEESLNDLNLEH